MCSGANSILEYTYCIYHIISDDYPKTALPNLGKIEPRLQKRGKYKPKAGNLSQTTKGNEKTIEGKTTRYHENYKTLLYTLRKPNNIHWASSF